MSTFHSITTFDQGMAKTWHWKFLDVQAQRKHMSHGKYDSVDGYYLPTGIKKMGGIQMYSMVHDYSYFLGGHNSNIPTSMGY